MDQIARHATVIRPTARRQRRTGWSAGFAFFATLAGLMLAGWIAGPTAASGQGVPVRIAQAPQTGPIPVELEMIDLPLFGQMIESTSEAHLLAETELIPRGHQLTAPAPAIPTAENAPSSGPENHSSRYPPVRYQDLAFEEANVACDAPAYHGSPQPQYRPTRLPPAGRLQSCGCAAHVRCQCRPAKRQVHHVFVERPGCDTPAGGSPAHAAETPPTRPAPPPGAFVAPPQRGAVVAESRSTGLRGMRITLPAITLALPSIELPSIIRRSRAPKMELEAGQAAYVAGAGQRQSFTQQASFGMPIQQQAATRPNAVNRPAVAAPQAAAKDRVENTEKDFAALQDRCERLESLLQKMVDAQEQVHRYQPAPAQPACDYLPR